MTPCTMLLMSERVRPCSERLRRSSSGRVTWMTFFWSSTVTFMAGCGLSSSLPLGPSTRSLPPSSATLTPPGMATGCLPIRDMVIPYSFVSERRLVDGAEQLAAQALGAGLAVAHDAAAGAEDGDAQAVEDGAQVLVAVVEAATGLAGAGDAADDALALGAVLEEDAQDFLRARLIDDGREVRLALLVGGHRPDLVVEDEALVLEHLGDALLELGGRHVHGGGFDAVGVADPRENVRDGIGQHDGELLHRAFPCGGLDAATRLLTSSLS